MARVVDLSTIRIDGGTQPRESIDQKTVDEYAESYAALVKMPPVVIYFDGANAWLADGFHRYHAAKKSGVQAIDADWREGTLDMAKFYAAGANVGHGLRRKDADKKRAIIMLLETTEGKKWSTQHGGIEKIRKHCGVSQPYASEVVANYRTDKLPSRAEKRAKVERALAEKPTATAREIAAEAGVSHTTVENIREEKARCSAKGEAPAPVAEPAAEEVNATAPAKPPAAYSSRSAADTAKIITDALRIARGAFGESDWRRLVDDVEKQIAARAE